MPARATAAPVAARAATAAAPTFAVQRCSCGSGEKDGQCEECCSQAVQTSPLAGSPGAPPAAANGAAGHALGALDIFYRSPDEEAGDRGGAIQRSTAVTPPPGREEAEEPGTGSLVDVNVEDLGDLLSAARDKKTGVMHIVGSGLTYFKDHEVTEGIRQDFIEMLRQKILDSKGNSGTLKGTYRAGRTVVYGGRMWDFSAENLFSKGTWMIGKNDQPTIEYELSYSRIALEAWSADWKAAWRIRDNLDLKGGTDQTPFYNLVAKPVGWLWHDVLGGKTSAPVNIDWHESGELRVGPPLESTGTKIRTVRPGDVRQW